MKWRFFHLAWKCARLLLPALKNKWRCQVLFCLRIYHSRRVLPARPNYMVSHNRISLINHEPGFLRRHVCKSEKYESCRWDPQTCRRIDFRGRVSPRTHVPREILHIFSVFNTLFGFRFCIYVFNISKVYFYYELLKWTFWLNKSTETSNKTIERICERVVYRIQR